MRPDRVRSLAAVLVLAATAEAAGAAEPKSPPRRELRRRTLVVDDQSIGSLADLHVAGGSATILSFEVPVEPKGALIMGTPELFHPPTQSDRTVILVPKVDLVRPVPLSIALADGTALSFRMLTAPLDADVQVDVMLKLKSRAPPESAEALRTTIAQLRSELDECRGSSVTAGAARLAALLLAQSLDEPLAFERHSMRGGDRQRRLIVEARWVYRLVGLTYLVFNVANRDPDRSWVFDRAEVKLTGGAEPADLPVLASAASADVLAPGQESKVIVAFKTPARSTSHRYAVAFVERDGDRRVVLEGLSP
ncbi:MAG: DUF2381 family protein [Deltaproteobacteria bacterium]|nr:DUF2381 family protein [Deltaproteobacteria bacterium]